MTSLSPDAARYGFKGLHKVLRGPSKGSLKRPLNSRLVIVIVIVIVRPHSSYGLNGFGPRSHSGLEVLPLFIVVIVFNSFIFLKDFPYFWANFWVISRGKK